MTHGKVLFKVTLGRIDPSHAVSLAQTDEQRRRAHFYAGARCLTERDALGALKHLADALPRGEANGFEEILAKSELRRTFALNSQDDR